MKFEEEFDVHRKNILVVLSPVVYITAINSVHSVYCGGIVRYLQKT